ncbi:Rho termination factor N-terminal domain-containing protein [Nitratifractor salsuginis]|uniref:Rho termination factor domain protein n=1 Tax=Nitratifractor salsuginis (strain DSM 16511 / JCM 12458 / E9I37-1) TaxID=749222 RepID=E6X1P2_NITSE|nr:Rho termination factor N-terminal domain-containing protein [Nitratifractor salsuginis]ADV47033.1 Rho termination factor domain protein [Nitratifractor salsuginis DSM 16511]
MRTVTLKEPRIIAGREMSGVVTLHDDLAARLILAGLANDEVIKPGDGLEDLTVKELKALAEERGIDLSDAKKKQEIIEAIRGVQR